MNFESEYLVFIIVGVCSIISLATAKTSSEPDKSAQCLTKCFDCTECDYNLEPANTCSTKLASLYKLLSIFNCMLCRFTNGCNKPTWDITVYPNAYYGEEADLKARTIHMPKNCCYAFPQKYDKTLSSIKTYNECVELYENNDCTGKPLRINKKCSMPGLDRL